MWRFLDERCEEDVVCHSVGGKLRYHGKYSYQHFHVAGNPSYINSDDIISKCQISIVAIKSPLKKAQLLGFDILDLPFSNRKWRQHEFIYTIPKSI